MTYFPESEMIMFKFLGRIADDKYFYRTLWSSG